MTTTTTAVVYTLRQQQVAGKSMRQGRLSILLTLILTTKRGKKN